MPIKLKYIQSKKCMQITQKLGAKAENRTPKTTKCFAKLVTERKETNRTKFKN
jgi:hypothetical protein